MNLNLRQTAALCTTTGVVVTLCAVSGAGALTTAKCSIDFEGGRSGDKLAIVLHRLHEPDECVGPRLAYK